MASPLNLYLFKVQLECHLLHDTHTSNPTGVGFSFLLSSPSILFIFLFGSGMIHLVKSANMGNIESNRLGLV